MKTANRTNKDAHIAYLEQCVRELEAIALDLAAGEHPTLTMGEKDYWTPYNSPGLLPSEFGSRLDNAINSNRDRLRIHNPQRR
jgi:hypothetical protein